MSTTYLLKVFAIYLYVFCDQTTSKKLSSPEHKYKLEECERCKLLTDSFNHWLEKTARSNYAGGDTAWEEAKLKSYSRSELRLVEVQESLCSELRQNQDDCYMLVEEMEQVLEKWWFNEDPNVADLYSWLCIDNLKHCCPLHHFGKFCSPCALDKDNNICSGHGKCHGEGTRHGNGSCVCQRGYTGEYCEACATNFYRQDDYCESCHRACDGCSGKGPAACHRCKPGWQLLQANSTCVDINECNVDTPCQSSEFCLNKVGSYTCKSCDSSCNTCNGPGPSNCTSCDSTHLLWSNMCITNKQKLEHLINNLKRLGLYLGLLIISMFIFRTSKLLASIVVIVISVYIYYSEQSSNINLIDVSKNLLGIDFVDHFYNLFNIEPQK